MFGYISGKLVNITPTQVYVDLNGLGYEVQITLNTYDAIKDKATAHFFTYLHIREDAWTLFGFSTELEKETFKKLLSVSGIGAATARLLLSSLTPNEFASIVHNSNSAALQKVKGIGSKTAQRIILELKGKLPEATEAELLGNSHNTIEQDTLNALLGLGIAKSMAEGALKKTKALVNEQTTVEERIKVALKNL